MPTKPLKIKAKYVPNKIFISVFFMITTVVFSQRSLSGIVLDFNDQTKLSGVNITIANKSDGSITDFDGNFNLSVAVGDRLQFSYVGYKTVEYVVTDFDFLTLRMTEDLKTLDEIVVIGYGATNKRDATGAVVSIKQRDMNKGNMVTPENLLQGRVAGVSINTGGAPGAGSIIRIRGGSSLNASNDPLIVIDDLPIDNTIIGGSRSILSTLNPNEIESFSILKDASAAAIYGSRASNGVIIITTKKGSKNIRATLDTSSSYNTLVNKIEVFDAERFRGLVGQQHPDLVGRLGAATTDWQDAIYENTTSSNLNLSVSGAAFGTIPSRLSLGRSNQNGLRLTSNYERNTVSLSVNPSFFDSQLKISLHSNYSNERNRFASDQEGNALSFDPTQPIYDPNSPFGGFFQYYADDNNGVLNQNDLVALAPLNPVAELLQRKSLSDVNRFYGNFKIDYHLHTLPELSATVNLGLDHQEASGSVAVSDLNPLSQNDGRIIGSSLTYKNAQENFLLDGYLNYKKRHEAIQIDLTTGYSYQKFQSNQYTTNELLDDGVDSEPVTNIDPDLVLLAYFSRLNLGFQDQYVMTLTYRRDGTSRFSKKNRWGNFPSAAFAWQIKETLFKEVDYLSTLKLRLGWGITGQQDIGRDNLDLYLDRYTRGLPSSQYQFGGSNIPIGIPSFRNEDLRWEETRTYNAGIDAGILENRFTASVDVFQKKSSNLLVQAAVSDGSNFSNTGFQNIGEFTSQGIEVALQGDIVKGEIEDFNLNVSLNSSVIRTEVTRLFQNEDILTGNIAGGTGNTAQIHRVGYTPFSFFVYKQVYDTEGFPIEGTYADLNGDNIINDADKYIHNNGAPSASFGFASNMSYKGFDLSFNLRAQVGNYAYNNINSSRAQYNLIALNSVVSNLPTSILQTHFNSTENVILSDVYIENASFLRMDNATLGYAFSEVFNSKASLRLSGSVRNVFTLTRYSGIDPEVYSTDINNPANGIDNTVYPRPRTFLLNATIQF